MIDALDKILIRSGGMSGVRRLATMQVALPGTSPMSWSALGLFINSRDRSGVEAPRRTQECHSLYEKYKAWCTQRGLTNAQYVESYANWEDAVVTPGKSSDESGQFAFEPCTFPYHLEADIHHWILWHHPNVVRGTETLEPQEELATVASLLNFPSLTNSHNAICYQNEPSVRSVPTIAHSHVFIREPCEVLLGTLTRRRAEWLLRSPFLQTAKL